MEAPFQLLESLPVIVNFSQPSYVDYLNASSANLTSGSVCTEYAQYQPEPHSRPEDDFQFCTLLGESDNFCAKLNRSSPSCQDPCMYNTRFRLIGTLVQGLIFIIGKFRDALAENFQKIARRRASASSVKFAESAFSTHKKFSKNHDHFSNL